MDLSLIGAAVTAINTARDIGRGALAVRDWNVMATRLASINEQLLQAQDALFAHNAALLGLQQEVFESRQQLRELQEALRERGRYTLVDLGGRKYAYRLHVAPQQTVTAQAFPPEPDHYVCQSCFDNGRKVVLQHSTARDGRTRMVCPVCRYVIRIT